MLEINEKANFKKVKPRPKLELNFTQKLLAKVHILKGSLQLDDSSYRKLLQEVCKKSSAAHCSNEELIVVCQRLQESLDDIRQPQLEYLKTNCMQMKKIMMLWQNLGSMGVLHQPDIKGLNNFLLEKFNTQILDINEPYLENALKSKIIEGLKAWTLREQPKAIH